MNINPLETEGDEGAAMPTWPLPHHLIKVMRERRPCCSSGPGGGLHNEGIELRAFPPGDAPSPRDPRFPGPRHEGLERKYQDPAVGSASDLDQT
ncbi:unnamed protein product [Boreogadus saida]